MLRRDSDGNTEIDVLGGSWATEERRRPLRDVFARARDSVHRQRHEHQQTGSRKLISRYEALVTYFADHAASWQG